MGQEEGDQSRFHLFSLCPSQNIYFLEYLNILIRGDNSCQWVVFVSC